MKITLQQNRMDNILDAEIAWKEFCWDVADIDVPTHNAFRYVRVNPNLSRDPPHLDEVNELKRLQEEARSSLKTPDSLAQLERIAHVLVASTFYYERTAAPRSEMGNVYSCSGNPHDPQ